MKLCQITIVLALSLNLLLVACVPTPKVPTPCVPTPATPTPTPTHVSIDDSLEDATGKPIEDKNSAPYQVHVTGVVQNACGLYLYLVVDDGNAEYIQPDVIQTGQIGSENFAGYYYLGINNDPGSLNKQYSISAVVTDRKYMGNEYLDPKTVVARSNAIPVFRTR